MKVLIVTVFAFASAAVSADIYRCETAEGVVFSDRECGASAEVIDLDDDSAGISIGPTEETRAYLAEQREARAAAREERREARAQQPQPPPAPIVIEQPVSYPYWWGNRPPGSRPPGLRPPPNRPSPPVRPPARPGGGDVIRPR